MQYLKKRNWLIGIIAVLGLMVITGCSSISNMKPKGNAQSIERLAKEKKQAYVIYKNTCETCQKMVPQIKKHEDVLRKRGVKLYYIDVAKTDEMPKFLLDNMTSDVATGRKLPIIVTFNEEVQYDGKYMPIAVSSIIYDKDNAVEKMLTKVADLTENKEATTTTFVD